MTEREDTIERIERVLKLTHKKSLTITIPRLTAERVVSMLKEQEPYIPKEIRLNRDEYCRVGDVLDCFEGMDMKADEVFHAVCLIEWAMSKRSVPLDQLLKEQESVAPKTTSSDYDTDTWWFVCGSCKKGVISPGDKFCCWCGKPVKWE